MARSLNNLQPTSLVVHETQIYDVIYDDFRMKELILFIDIAIQISRYVSCYFAPSMTFQHIDTCVGIVLRDIKHALFVNKTHAIINWYMEGRHVTLGIENFSKLITYIEF
ncbi:hypothetical protein CR513_11235, partial [Mucuna pruriens]